MNALDSPRALSQSQMNKPGVLLLSTGQPEFDLIIDQVKQMGLYRVEVATFENLMNHMADHDPDIVVLDISSLGTEEIGILSTLRGNYGSVPIVVVSESLDDPQVRKLIKLKVHDWLRKPLILGDFLNSIQSGIRISKHSNNKVHAVVSAVGGAGGTTVAVSLADILARKEGKDKGSVALFDLDFSLGSCSYMLNIASSMKIDSVLSNPSRIDAEFVNLIQQKHDNGMNVYSFKHPSIVTHLNCYELVLRLLDVVTAQHASIVLDIPYYDADWRPDVLFGVNSVTIVTDLNLPSIKHTMDLLKSIQDLREGPKAINVLVNKHTRRLFGRDRIPKAKLKEFFGPIPFDYLPLETTIMADAMDRGVTPNEVNSSSRFLKMLTKHANSLIAVEKEAS